MSTRLWWLVGAALTTTVVVVVLAVVWLTGPSNSDCATVRKIVAYNDDHNAVVARNGDGETPESDYEAWAVRLRELADQVTTPDLAQHTDRVADLADQTVSVLRQARDDTTGQPGPTAPPWVSEYANLNAEFAEETHILDQRCPA